MRLRNWILNFEILNNWNSHNWLIATVKVSVSLVMSYSLNPTDCSPPGSSVQGILQARILEQVAIFFSRGSSQYIERVWHQNGGPSIQWVQFPQLYVNDRLKDIISYWRLSLQDGETTWLYHSLAFWPQIQNKDSESLPHMCIWITMTHFWSFETVSLKALHCKVSKEWRVFIHSLVS